MHKPRLPRPDILALSAIVLAGLAFRSWGISWGLQGATVSLRPHPDEWAVYWLFHWFDSSRSLNPCPNLKTQCFFDWGAGFPYPAYLFRWLASPFLNLIPSAAFGAKADPEFVRSVLAGRIFSVATSTATIAVVYRLGSMAYGKRAGLVAALLIALSALPIQLAHFATPDSTTNLLLSLSLLAMLHAMREPSRSRFAVAGGLIGLAAGTEYHMALLLIPLCLACLLSEGKNRHVLVSSFLLAAATFLLVNPYIVLDSRAFFAALDHIIRIHTVDSALQYQDRWSHYGPPWLYILRYPLGYGVGAAFTAILVLGFVWGGLRREKDDLLLASWTIVYFLLATLSSAKFMRYSAPLLPGLSVLGGGFVASWLLAPRPRMLRLGSIVALAAAVLYSTSYDAAYAQLFSAPEPRALVTAWLREHSSKSSEIDFEEATNGLLNLPDFAKAAGYRPCFLNFEETGTSGSPHLLIADDYDLEEHPGVREEDAKRFREELVRGTAYHVVKRIHYVPSLFSLSFPIDNSPHDWRYPSHRITVYATNITPSRTPANCSAGSKINGESRKSPTMAARVL